MAGAGAFVPQASTVRSADGTAIAYQRIGRGPAVILIDGALCHRKLGQSAGLAELLAEHFTVYRYDRRGRGESGDTAPYAVEREVDDIAAIVAEAGGSAYVWGMSSGAVLALEAAKRIRGIGKVAVYEAPLIVDDRRPSTRDDWAGVRKAIAADRRGEAVKTFLRSVGLPSLVIGVMRLLPLWSKLKAIAPTLVYDGAIVEPHQQGKSPRREQWAAVTVPTLVTDGGKSPQWMRDGNRALAEALPNARYETLSGQTHNLKPAAHVKVLTEFFEGPHP
jgi:pimeloyl-ACP methyl ester carboxylesterase